jgi:hypothetical protein
MPGGDRTGPAGLGPMTGRGAGYCAGFDVPGYANPVPRRYTGVARGAYDLPTTAYPRRYPLSRPRGGRGRGFGRGRSGWCW